MIVKREKIITKFDRVHFYTILRTSWWLLGIVPLLVSNKIIARR